MKIYVLLALVLVLFLGLRYLGGDGLPFDADKVSQIKFRYSVGDSVQIVVNDYSTVQKIVDTLKVEPKERCLCGHTEEVVFVIDGAEYAASVCSHCFDLTGRYKGYLTMSPEFYGTMKSYQDSSALQQPWDGKSAL